VTDAIQTAHCTHRQHVTFDDVMWILATCSLLIEKLWSSDLTSWTCLSPYGTLRLTTDCILLSLLSCVMVDRILGFCSTTVPLGFGEDVITQQL
jgi:hypothetical protein